MLTEYEASVIAKARTSNCPRQYKSSSPSLVFMGIAAIVIGIVWGATSQRADSAAPDRAASSTARGFAATQGEAKR